MNIFDRDPQKFKKPQNSQGFHEEQKCNTMGAYHVLMCKATAQMPSELGPKHHTCNKQQQLVYATPALVLQQLSTLHRRSDRDNMHGSISNRLDSEMKPNQTEDKTLQVLDKVIEHSQTFCVLGCLHISK